MTNSTLKNIALSVAMMLSATAFAQEANYVKVKEAPEDWSGEYLIVREYDDVNNIALVFNGALEDLDKKDNYIQASNPYITYENEEVRAIAGTETVDAATFIITPSAETEGMYYIQSKSGYWIGFNSTEPDPTTGVIEPNLKFSNEKQYDNSIALEEGGTNVIITAKNGFELRFNPDSGTLGRFRYHASGKKKSIKLYKKDMVTDGIEEVSSELKASGVAYDIMGRKVNANSKGLHIVDGKTVFVK